MNSCVGAISDRHRCRRWIIFDQVIELSLQADVRFALKATEIARRCTMSRWAHKRTWPCS